MRELGEKDEWQTGYSQSGERWGERAETKAFENIERYKKNLITILSAQHSAE